MRFASTILLAIPVTQAFLAPSCRSKVPMVLQQRDQHQNADLSMIATRIGPSVRTTTTTKRDSDAMTRGKALFSENPIAPTSSEDTSTPTNLPQVNANQLQTLAYVLTSLAYLAISGVIFFMPDKTNTAKLEIKLGGACGFAMAAFLSNVLAQASSRNRLGKQDAYKKLNLGLLAFCAIGLFAVPGESAFTPLSIPATLLAGFMSMVRVIGGATAYFGWRAGIKKNVVEELAEGVKTTKESMDLEKKSKGWFYKYATVFVGFGVLSSLMTIGKSKLDFDISLEVSAISRLFLVASMFLTLKDANDKDQLAGKTFVQMNFLIAAWTFIVGLGQGIQQSTYGFAFDFRKAKMIFCALPFFFKAMKGQKDATAPTTP